MTRSLYGEPRPRPASRRPGKLRIGYLSGDFRNHVMGKMMWEALRHHDRERFEVFGYRDERRARRMDGALRIDFFPAYRTRRTDRSRRRAAHCRRRSRCAGRPVDAHQRRAPADPRDEAGTRADHPCRERGNAGDVGNRFQADRPLRRPRRRLRPDAADRAAAGDGRMRLSLSPCRAGARSDGHPGKPPDTDASGGDRRIRHAAEAVAALPRVVARRRCFAFRMRCSRFPPCTRRCVPCSCASARRPASTLAASRSCRRVATMPRTRRAIG